jgi:hypothetical protein
LPSLPPGLRLVKNGSYLRQLDLDGGPGPARIFRKCCAGCHTSFTLLPNDVVPLHTYSLRFIAARVEASLRGVADRDRQFYEERGLIPDEPDFQNVSWSDRLNDKPLRPSHRLFARWRGKWAMCSRPWLFALLSACIYVGCDLRTQLGQSLEAMTRCPELMSPLALAAGLMGLLRDESAWTALPAVIRLTACRPSHKPARAGGRPPPQYGGALEFLTSQGDYQPEVAENESC